MSTLLRLEPTNLSTITFSGSVGSTGFYVPYNTINLNESQRREILYSETRAGGKAINYKNRLTPIEFVCFVWGNTRQEMLDRAKQLHTAVITGGVLVFQPDGASQATYYEYEPSTTPSLFSTGNNQWDNKIVENAKYVTAFSVSLMSHPYGRSNSYTAIVTNQTLDAGHNPATYSSTLTLNGIKGDVPALLQINVTPPTITINRIYVSLRSPRYGLPTTHSFGPVTFADGTWATTVDANRTFGRYVSRALEGNPGYVSLTLDSTKFKGLITVLAVIKSDSVSQELKVGVRDKSNTLLWTSNQIFNPEILNKWHILYVGEHQFPFVNESSVGSATKLTIECNGFDNIQIESIIILFGDESIRQTNISDTRTVGIGTGTYLLDESTMETSIQDIVNTGAAVAKPQSVYRTVILTAEEGSVLYTTFESVSSATNLYEPGNEIVMSVSAMFRTTYPFS